MALKVLNVADKETVDEILSLLKTDGVYGFIEYNAILAPASRIEYIGANLNYTPLTVNKTTGEATLNSWGNFPFLVANKPYMVKSDGTPDYRLDENDYTLREDGTASDVANADYDGGAFSWAMKIYKQEYMVGTDRYVLFSFAPRDGFEAVGFIDPDGNELEGVWIPMFNGHIDAKGVMRSISGTQSAYSKTTAQEKAAIDLVSDRAKFFGGPIVNTIVDLLIMWAKTTNLQSAYGDGNMSGYVSTLSPTYGVLENAVVSGGQFYGTSDGKSLNKILHSVVLGSYQQWQRDPYTLLVNGRYKVSKNYAYDVTGATYTDTGIDMPMMYKTDGTQNTGTFYPHKYQTVPGFGALPVYPFKGSTSTGGCDGYWQNVAITAVALRVGNCSNGAAAGLRALLVNHAASIANWNIGASVLLLPPVGVAA